MSKVDPDANGGTTLARKVTAVGTMGAANQLFTVYEANWHCVDCGQENYAARPKCFRCRKAKPAGLNNYVMDPAMLALQQGKVIPWQEVVDPTTYQIYYHNKETNETQWERPAEMGPAPVATGWFGRGKAGSNAAKMYAEKNKHYLTRLARKQKEFIDPKKYHMEGANEFNIWYGRYIGDMANRNDTEPASDRCVVETDAGATKADLVVDEKKRRKYFCLHFAHGGCAKGPECTFYHRIPLPEDDAQVDELFDCFGRQRHSKHRDDMNGTGSFLKPCRTLFVGNLLKQKYDTPKALEDALWRHFGEWGEVESINVIHRLSIAFPRFRLRTSAEFAKEAMTGQPLDKGEILMIRWAHDDPNPVAQDSIDRADKDALVGLMASKGISLTPAAFEYPADYQLPDAKRPRLTDGSDGGGAGGGSVDPSVFQQYPELAYPNTDGQFVTNTAAATTTTAAGSASGDASAAATTVQIPGADGKPKTVDIASQEYAEYYADYCAKYYAQQEVLTRFGVDITAMEAEQAKVAGAGSSSSSSGSSSSEAAAKGEDEGEEDEEEEWSKQTDEATGATYYFNTVTGESSWTDPKANK